MPGGPRVQLVDSAFRTLTGFEPPSTLPANQAPPDNNSQQPDRLRGTERPTYRPAPPPAATLAPLGQSADDVPGILGALRDRMGLIDDNVNTVDEEKIRTSFLTLVDLIVDLQDSWGKQRVAFGSDAGRGFLGTELILINRLLAAAAEQVDEVEAVLDSALISAAERQTIVLDRITRLTLDGLLSWMRTFLTEDGPRIIQDTGRDGITTSFTPTAITLLQTLRDTLVAQLPAGERRNGAVPLSLLPVGCCSTLPSGMYAARSRIAISGLCSLFEQLVRNASRIGRFSGVILFDLFVSPYLLRSPQAEGLGFRPDFLRVEVRGLHLRPTYLPAFVRENETGRTLDELVLPVQGSASADTDTMVAVFRGEDINAIALPGDFPPFNESLFGRSSWTVPAAAVPLAVVDGETGRVVLAPRVRSWPDLTPASAGGPLALPTEIGNVAQTSTAAFEVPPDDVEDDCTCVEPEPTEVDSRYDGSDGFRPPMTGVPGPDQPSEASAGDQLADADARWERARQRQADLEKKLDDLNRYEEGVREEQRALAEEIETRNAALRDRQRTLAAGTQAKQQLRANPRRSAGRDARGGGRTVAGQGPSRLRAGGRRHEREALRSRSRIQGSPQADQREVDQEILSDGGEG